MQDVHALIRCLLPPGRVTTCTVWMLGSHRRLVRRWECDTDLPKPGPFPQISHTAAILQAPQNFGGPAPRIDLDEPERPRLTRASPGYRLLCATTKTLNRLPTAATGAVTPAG